VQNENSGTLDTRCRAIAPASRTERELRGHLEAARGATHRSAAGARIRPDTLSQSRVVLVTRHGMHVNGSAGERHMTLFVDLARVYPKTSAEGPARTARACQCLRSPGDFGGPPWIE
jgi:hypothetical protein